LERQQSTIKKLPTAQTVEYILLKFGKRLQKRPFTNETNAASLSSLLNLLCEFEFNQLFNFLFYVADWFFDLKTLE